MNEHWFTSLAHARAVIEAWRCEYNQERPKKSLGRLTPAAYAKHLAKTATKMPGKLKTEPLLNAGGRRSQAGLLYAAHEGCWPLASKVAGNNSEFTSSVE